MMAANSRVRSIKPNLLANLPAVQTCLALPGEVRSHHEHCW